MRSDPAVSVPVAAGVVPEASAAPEPPLEPPAERSSAHGFPTWSVVPPAANSCVCRWPRSTIPSAESRAHTSQSSSGTSSSRRLDAVNGLPATREDVLEPDRDAAERAGTTCGQPLVRPRGGGERVLLVDPHPGVHRRRVAVVTVRPVALANPVEARLRQLDRAELTPGERRGGLGDRQVGRAAHRASLS